MVSKKKILVVDDEKAITNLMDQVFTRAGYEVSTAESSEKALELLENQVIHVMFLDLNMPGMNGIELCRRIKKKLPIAMVFAITGFVSLFELAECREAGFDDYFKKPMDMKSLVKTVEDAFLKIERWKKN